MKPDFWLFFLYFIFICLSIFASILLLIVVLLLRRFDVFHINLRILLWQTLSCIILNLSVQILRPILLLIQNDEFKIENPAENCPELNEFPAPFCLFICFSGILICMERLYATFNFAKYENEQFEWILSKIFGAMWLFVGFYSIIDFCFDLFPAISKIGYLDCRMHQIRINPLKSNWHLLFTILFHCVFCLVISVVLSVNKEKQEVYVKLHYSSLSHRFQIAENVKSVRLLLKIVPQLGLAAALLLFHSVWLYIDSTNRTEMELMIRAECGLLIMPILSSTIAYTIIRSSNVFKTKSKLIASQLWQKVRNPGKLLEIIYKIYIILLMQISKSKRTVWWRGNEEIGGSFVKGNEAKNYSFCQNCGKRHAATKKAICETELLREYWDDDMHIQ